MGYGSTVRRDERGRRSERVRSAERIDLAEREHRSERAEGGRRSTPVERADPIAHGQHADHVVQVEVGGPDAGVLYGSHVGVDSRTTWVSTGPYRSGTYEYDETPCSERSDCSDAVS